MKLERVLAVVPARGGSKGLPGKNIRSLNGLPLLVHTLRCASMAPELTRTIVSTDSEEIAAVATQYGGDVPFMRPTELAVDSSAMWPVIKHALAATEQLDGISYDAVLLLAPTNPGRLPSDISSACAALADDPVADGVIAVSTPDFNPYWHGMLDGEDGYLKDLYPEARKFTRRQDLPRVYRINGALYLWRSAFVRDADDWRTGRLLKHEIPEARAIDIDSLEQFEDVDWRLRTKRMNFPWQSTP